MIRRHYWKPQLHRVPPVCEEMPLYFIDVQLPAGTWRDTHVHEDFAELAYTVSGSIVVCTEEGNYLGGPHRAIWIPPGIRHEWYLPEPSGNRTLFIHRSAIPEHERFSRYHAFDVLPLLRELILCASEFTGSFVEPHGERLIQVFLDRLALAGESGQRMLMPREHRLIEICSAYLTRPDRAIRLSDWSRKVGMSEKSLTRIFKKETGLTCGRWMRAAVLHHARVRIESGQDITYTAFDCGYSSASAFIVAFRKLFGLTPGMLAKCRHSSRH